MTTMPYWLNKTPEMIAMDRWFSGEDLANRYKNAIASIKASQPSNVLPTSSQALNSSNSRLPGGSAGALLHFGKHWLNPNNPSSGGDYWPHVPTFTIISWFQTGVLAAAQKGLGWTELTNMGTSAADVFDSEVSSGRMAQTELDGVLPLVTTWVCTSPAGTGTIEVDAVRGPTVVELVIATPQPKLMQSRVWQSAQQLIDEQWLVLHGGPDTINHVDHDQYLET